MQSLQVKPSENQLELPYLKRNMTATLAAYGVDQVEVTPNYSAVTTASPEQLRKDAASIPGIRIIDPNVVSPTFKQQQAQRVYYAMPDPLDVDRYTIKGEERDAVVAVRELDLSGMPAGQRNWLNDHTVNTHGYGFVAAFGNTKNSDGSPRYFEANVPSTGDLGAYEPRIYYGEKSPDYSVVGAPAGSPPAEFDYLDDSASSQAKTTYAGKGGVSLSGLGKFAYAIKYREINFLLSEAVNSDSKILENRSPRDRVAKIAPWLTLDGNVYPAVVDKKVVWIVDGYTTSANYPNSQMSQFGQATADSVTARGSANVQAVDTGQVNYIRNSVKATVDAYDGTVHLYAWDATDPVLQTWSKIFPGTVEPMSNISADLMSHLRYPEDLFKVQRDVLSKYHVTDPTAFYGGQDFWRVPDDPTRAGTGEMPPYYLSIQMPGQTEPKFSLTTSFMPNGDRQILSGFLAVDGDAGKAKGERSADYGKLRLLVLAKGSSVTGPGQVYNEMRNSAAGTKDPALPQALGLGQYINNANSSSGAHAIFGNQLTVPIAKGLLYVQPLYLQAQNSYPLLNVIVVSFGNKIAWASTLEGALDQLFGGAVVTTPPTTGTPTTPTTPPSGTPTTSGPATPTGSATGDPAALKQALADAQTAYNDGQEALKRGDFTAYGDAQKRLKEALDRAVRASPQGGSLTLTP